MTPAESTQSSRREEKGKRGGGQGKEPGSYEADGVRVWAKNWAQVLDDCKQRLRFVKANLEIQPTSESAFDFLHPTYERFLPNTLREAQEPPATASG